MALPLPAHAERRIHVHIMAREIQADQSLENHAIRRFRSGQEHQQTRRRAAVGHHIQHSAESRALPELPRREAVERIEQARDGVEEAASPWMQGHEVKGCDGKYDSSIAWGKEGGCVSTLLKRTLGGAVAEPTD